jgi:hypothetical protein
MLPEIEKESNWQTYSSNNNNNKKKGFKVFFFGLFYFTFLFPTAGSVTEGHIMNFQVLDKIIF